MIVQLSKSRKDLVAEYCEENHIIVPENMKIPEAKEFSAIIIEFKCEDDENVFSESVLSYSDLSRESNYIIPAAAITKYFSVSITPITFKFE